MSDANVSKLTGYSLIGGSPDDATASKLTGGAVLGGSPDDATVSKLEGYGLLGGAPAKATAAKLQGYGLLGGSPDDGTVSKLQGYAVLMPGSPALVGTATATATASGTLLTESVVVDCPCMPISPGMSAPVVAPTEDYDEWAVYVESTDEFWMKSIADDFGGMVRLDAATGAVNGFVAVGSYNNYQPMYDPVYDKVWVEDDEFVQRVDVATGTPDLTITVPTGWAVGRYPMNFLIDRNNGSVWTVGGNGSGSGSILHWSADGDLLGHYISPAHRFMGGGVDAAGNYWASTGPISGGLNTLVQISPTGTLLSSSDWDGTLERLAYDEAHNAVWFWEVRRDLGFPFPATIKRYDIAGATVAVSISQTFTNDADFEFDNVRNLVWAVKDAYAGGTLTLKGFCGNDGNVIHNYPATAEMLGDRNRIMTRRPGNNVYFDDWSGDFPAVGRYFWTCDEVEVVQVVRQVFTCT